MASTTQFKRYLWLVDVIYSAGEITRDEINRRWANSACNENKESVYAERTFHRHREDIASLFGIDIECSKSDGNVYRIANKERLQGIRSWIIDNFAINNLVNHADGLSGRLVFEDIPEGNRYLGSIATAMQENRKLFVSYQGFDRSEPHSFLLSPYCLKVFHQRWYLVGKPEDHPEEVDPRIYSLDRVRDIALTEKQWRYPKSFDAIQFFENNFGVDRRLMVPENVRIKVGSKTANYLRTLPLHHSQVEAEKTEEYSVFSYHVAPTYDFIQELRKQGADLEVLAPESLRNRFVEDCENLSKIYASNGQKQT